MDEIAQKKAKVIVVEDESLIAMDLTIRLEKFGYKIIGSYASGEDIVRDIHSLDADVIMMDINLDGEIDGIETAAEIKKLKDIPIVFLTAYIDDKTFQRAKLTEPAAYLTKPFIEAELYKTLELAIYGHEMKKKLKESEMSLNLIFQNVSEYLILWEVGKEGLSCLKCNLPEREMQDIPLNLEKKDIQFVNFCNNENFFQKEKIDTVIQKAISVSYELTKEFKDSIKYYAIQITPITKNENTVTHILGIIRDITERRVSEENRLILEAQLRQSQKLEAIGSLASGMAHEINNPLMGVINYSQLIRDKMEKDSQLWKYASSIEEEGYRISTIVQNLLSFAHRKNDTKKPEEVKDIIDSALKLTHLLFKKSNIHLEVKIPEGLPKAICRIQEIHQVLLNLFNNSKFALNQKYPTQNEDKILRIEASLITEKEFGPMIRIQVEDHGTGIRPDIIEKIFDPFYTTKPRSEGTGLGLSVSYGIIRDHDGRLLVESEEGKFTRFNIDLPTNLKESII
ncbi:MAG: response regulator [Leptospiraceae bacterium]|nr:response regulator [Leptospiraceae bacterium]MCK6382623.1 response regulator [Leptospiraceae bacterium]NUM41884.1 response regulator [Leptospiraceae bacterium]